MPCKGAALPASLDVGAISQLAELTIRRESNVSKNDRSRGN
jgi:hypothetical protein